VRLIDTHCHLTHDRLRGQLEAVLDRARQAGVAALICAAGNLDESEAARKLAATNEDIFFLAGQHPHEAKDAPQEYLKRLEQLAADRKNVAVGEIGLDYHYDFSPRPIQRQVFAEQLELADRLAKPVVIHCREAFDETMDILRNAAIAADRVVFHSFTGPTDEIGRALDLGAMISFSGIVTFKKTADLREAARLVPADRLLIETDAPYLSPEPVRKIKTNEPAHVAHVAACLAEVRNVPVNQLVEQTAQNAIRFFSLDLQ